MTLWAVPFQMAFCIFKILKAAYKFYKVSFIKQYQGEAKAFRNWKAHWGILSKVLGIY